MLAFVSAILALPIGNGTAAAIAITKPKFGDSICGYLSMLAGWSMRIPEHADPTVLGTSDFYNKVV